MTRGMECTWPDLKMESRVEVIGVACVAPFRLPELLVAQIESGEVTCPVEAGELRLPPGHFSTSINWDTGFDIPDFNPNPAHPFALILRGWKPEIANEEQLNISNKSRFCPGTPLTIRSGSLDRRMSVAIELGSLGVENRADDTIEHRYVPD